MYNKETITNLQNILGKFKDLKRKGWLLRNVDTPESDAEHSFSLALLTLLYAPANLNLLKCLKLALIHDLPEIYSSDFVPGEITHEEKRQLEENAAKKLSSELQNKEILELFIEFTENKTPEARFVNALDKIDNIFTAQYFDNHQRSPHKLTPEFAQTAKERIEAMGEEAAIPEKILKTLLNQQH